MSKYKSQLKVRLKAIKNAIRFSLLLFYQLLLLISNPQLSNLGLFNWLRGD